MNEKFLLLQSREREKFWNSSNLSPSRRSDDVFYDDEETLKSFFTLFCSSFSSSNNRDKVERDADDDDDDDEEERESESEMNIKMCVSLSFCDREMRDAERDAERREEVSGSY